MTSKGNDTKDKAVGGHCRKDKVGIAFSKQLKGKYGNTKIAAKLKNPPRRNFSA